MNTPRRTRIYQNHHLDSTCWDAIMPRPDDIVIATPSKAGTTWTQTIVAYLLFPDNRFPAKIQEMSAWCDSGLKQKEAIVSQVESQTHRRFLKSHLPLDGTSYRETTKYIVVCRDGRDICMSLFNHLSNYNDSMLDRLKVRSAQLNCDFPSIPQDINAFWRNWCSKGWFEWQEDGWPLSSELQIMQSWWGYRNLPNIRLFHYANMLADTPGAIREMAGHLEIEVDDERVEEIAEIVSFANMKANSDQYAPGGGRNWVGGGDTFFNRGTNGRWRDEISEENLELYNRVAERTMSPKCLNWTENAGPLPE